jgi:hypothetical protein
MSELEPFQHGPLEQVHRPAGARVIGVRVKPALRIAIGFRDPDKRGAPTKTDYFIAKDGPDNEFARAAAKFREVYGDRPKAIEIRLPGEFGDALDIRYKAFAGGGGENGGGGVMTAKGDTNFALYDYVGGPDTLTIWRQDGSVEEVQTAGLDATTGEPLDEYARDLQLGLYTTFRFGIPNVLGYGSHCEITSKGKATTDTLWFKLRGFYGTFGHRTSFVLRPTLIVKPASARPVVQKRGEEPKRIKTRIYVLDLIPTETEDEMLERFREHRELTSAAAESLYAQPRELTEGVVVREREEDAEPDAAKPPIQIQGPETSVLQRETPGQTPPTGAATSADHSAESTEETPEAVVEEPPPLALAPEPALEGEYEDPDDPLALSDEEETVLPEMLKVKVPMGSYQGMTLTKLLTHGESANAWIRWALNKQWEKQDQGFHDALILVAKAHKPEVYAEWVAERSQ